MSLAMMFSTEPLLITLLFMILIYLTLEGTLSNFPIFQDSELLTIGRIAIDL